MGDGEKAESQLMYFILFYFKVGAADNFAVLRKINK